MPEPRYGPAPGAGVDAAAKAGEEMAASIKKRLLDPWADRAAGMLCRTCMWFVPKGTGDHRGALGRCRRRAPTMNGFPAVFEDDWCGDHKLDEVKI